MASTTLGTGSSTTVVMVLVACLSFLTSLTTVAFIKYQEQQAKRGMDFAIKSVIFPVFVTVLWAQALVALITAIVVSLLPLSPSQANSLTTSTVYAFVWSLQHGIIEGVAFLLMCKGCGRMAVQQAGRRTAAWMFFSFGLYFLFFSSPSAVVGDSAQLFLDLLLLVFYSSLIFLSQKNLFRRPAVIFYAKFWLFFRIVSTTIHILFFFPSTVDDASCSYDFFRLLFYALAQPLISYHTLLKDSRFWTGANDVDDRPRQSLDTLRSPLIGLEYTLQYAQLLSETVDDLGLDGNVKLLNFACIHIDTKTKLLGQGSFSRVYRGTYKQKECAVKLVFTLDITREVVDSIVAEASILASISHINVVRIVGVALLPPSCAMVLELCAHGCLSDVIRGPNYTKDFVVRPSLPLSYSDRLFLALGCSRGLAALHSTSHVHRDVKSFNFLVDEKLNAKIADLELGDCTGTKAWRGSVGGDAARASGASRGSGGGGLISEVQVEDVEVLQATWLAPEVKIRLPTLFFFFFLFFFSLNSTLRV